MRNGLRIRDYGVNPTVKASVLRFSKWLRLHYQFPMRVPVYLNPKRRLKASDGELCTGIFFAPYDPNVEPFIKIATGDFAELEQELGRDNALGSILCTLAHEILHYFEWLENKEMPEDIVIRKSREIIDLYAKTGKSEN